MKKLFKNKNPDKAFFVFSAFYKNSVNSSVIQGGLMVNHCSYWPLRKPPRQKKKCTCR